MRNIKGFVQAFFIAIVSGTSLLYAQNMSITSKYDKMVLFFDNVKPERHSIGHVEMRVYYNTETVIDTAAGTVMSERTVLEIGGKKTKYMTYNLFKLDSLLETTESSPFEVFIRQRMRDFYPQTFYEVYYTDYDSRTMQCTGRIVNTDFMYKENVPDLEWTVTDSTKSIGSWVVQKATCSFRGRNYTARRRFLYPMGPGNSPDCPDLFLRCMMTVGTMLSVSRVLRVTALMTCGLLIMTIFVCPERNTLTHGIRLSPISFCITRISTRLI